MQLQIYFFTSPLAVTILYPIFSIFPAHGLQQVFFHTENTFFSRMDKNSSFFTEKGFETFLSAI